jgi:4-amino-4-deoxy-L-arabinose transferase-like glycosyltransferase
MELSQKMKQRLEFLLVLALIALYFIWFAWPSVWTASDNLRLVSVFSSDEANHLYTLKQAISQRTLILDFGIYGHLYFNIALLPLFFLNFLIRVSEQQIILALRLVPTLSAIGTIAATFLITRRYFGRLAAWLAALLLSIVPLNFLHWSITSHPDIPQLFFLVLSLYFCCRLVEQDRPKWLIVASVFSGMAFACKYSGVLLLPIIWMIAVGQTIDPRQPIAKPRFPKVEITRLLIACIGIVSIIIGIVFSPNFVSQHFTVHGKIADSSLTHLLINMQIAAIIFGFSLIVFTIIKPIWSVNRFVNSLNKIILSVATFGTVFFLTSPFSFFRLNFLKGIYCESKLMPFGHWFKASNNGMQWFHVLLSPELIGKAIFGLAFLGMSLIIFDVSRKGWRQLLSPAGVIWMWVIFYFGFLFFRINMRFAHYLLPIIPFLIILSTQSISKIIEFAKSKLSKKLSFLFILVILSSVAAIELPKSVSQILRYRQSTINRVQKSTAVKAGLWLAKHFPKSTRIVYDHYCYVPPIFPDAHATWGGTIEMLKKIKPNIVVVNKKISSRYSDISQAAMYIEGESNFIMKHEYYNALRDKEAGYMLLRDFGDVKIYSRQ